jgi:hypothetical protein
MDEILPELSLLLTVNVKTPGVDVSSNEPFKASPSQITTLPVLGESTHPYSTGTVEYC